MVNNEKMVNELLSLPPFVFALLVMVFSTLLNIQIARAGSLGDIDGRFKQANAIENVAVSMQFLRDYDLVKRLPQYSCTYVSGNPKKIEDILKSFTEFNVRKMPENQVFLPIVEIEIHFSFKDGQKAVLYLGKRYLGEKTIDGELNIDNQSPLYFWVNRNLSERLQTWSQHADNTIFGHKDYHSESIVSRCQDRINGKGGSNPVSCGRKGAILSYPELCGNN